MTDQSLPLVLWMAFVSVVVPALLRGFPIGELVDQTLEECHISRKVAAGYLGATETQLARWLAGRGPEHLSADRLSRLPRIFWLVFVTRIAQHFGAADSAETRAARESRRMARQVRVSLRADRESACA